MCQMMMDEPEAGIRRSEASSKRCLPVVLTCQAHVPTKQTRDTGVIDRVMAFDHALEIMADRNTDRRPSKADEIQLLGSNGGKGETGPNRKFRKPRVVLDPTQPFFGDCKKDFAISSDASRRVVHL